MPATLSQFNTSYNSLQVFLRDWLQRISDRCPPDSDRYAAYLIWARYSMSFRTIEALLEPVFLPDLFVIFRGCIEFDASLALVIREPEFSHDYIEFEKHAKAKFINTHRQEGNLAAYIERKDQFRRQFGEEPEHYKWDKWCARAHGITGILKKLNRNVDLRLYGMLSHFAHGSVVALQLLDGRTGDPAHLLGKLVGQFYLKYLGSTREFLDFAWGPLAIPQGEQCTSDFNRVAGEYIMDGE